MTTTEYALMVNWSDTGDDIEFIPAKDAAHADHMAGTIYSHRPTWTVGREVPPWRFVNVGSTELTDEVAS